MSKWATLTARVLDRRPSSDVIVAVPAAVPAAAEGNQKYSVETPSPMRFFSETDPGVTSPERVGAVYTFAPEASSPEERDRSKAISCAEALTVLTTPSPVALCLGTVMPVASCCQDSVRALSKSPGTTFQMFP